MSFLPLTAEQVGTLHDMVLNPGERPGRARDKSLEEALSRVDNRLAYGMIGDVFDLAAADATAVATGHCSMTGTIGTAYRVMIVCLKINGVGISDETGEVGSRIVALAQGLNGAEEMAEWLRRRARD